MGMTRTTDFPTALKDTLHDVFEVTWNESNEQYSKVFDVNTSLDAYEDVLQVQGPDEIPLSTEGGVFERIDIENVRSKRYTHLNYKGEVKITREAIDDLKYNKCVDAVKKLSVASTRTIERLGASFFINGLTGAELSPDLLSVFHDAHTLNNPLSGNPSVCSNLGTGTLSNANIRAARVIGRRTRDEHGSLAPSVFTQLILPPDLEDEGNVQKMSELNPDNADHGKNVSGMKVKDIQILDFLAEAAANSSTAWFMRDPQTARNKFWWRKRPERQILRDPNSNDFLYRVYFRCSVGCDDWRGLFASTGTGSADSLGATKR
jgi:hypothetical protein